MSDLRDTLTKALRLNETHVAAVSASDVVFTTEEQALIQCLSESAAFQAYPKAELDRHTIKQLCIATQDFPVSIAERAARKAELLMARGDLNENLQLIDGKGNLLTEGEVPEERDAAASEGDGDLPQGDADTLSSEHDGEDHPSPGGERGEVDSAKDVTKQGDPGDGDASGTATKGYKQEEAKDVEHGHDEDDAFQLEGEDDEDELDEDGNIIKRDPNGKFGSGPNAGMPKPKGRGQASGASGNKARLMKKVAQIGKQQGLPEDCGAEGSTIPKAGAGDKDKEPDKDKGKLGEMDVPQDSTPSDMTEEGEEGSENDAPDPAPEDDRAASDARYKDGCKQNTGESKDPKDADSDLADTPDDYNEIDKEDPSNDPKNVGAADPKLESLARVEERIKVILREAGIKKGTKKWTEAYVKGWTLAMEHRASLLDN